MFDRAKRILLGDLVESNDLLPAVEIRFNFLHGLQLRIAVWLKSHLHLECRVIQDASQIAYCLALDLRNRFRSLWLYAMGLSLKRRCNFLGRVFRLIELWKVWACLEHNLVELFLPRLSKFDRRRAAAINLQKHWKLPRSEIFVVIGPLTEPLFSK